MKIRFNLELAFLYLIIISYISFFGFTEVSSDISLVLCVIFEVYIGIKYSKVKVKYDFKWWIISIIVLIIMSSIRSNQLYRQPLILGIRAQRQFFFVYMLYFPITKLLKIGVINKEQIEKMIYRIGTILLFLYSIYFFSNGNLKFLNYIYDYRYGGMRLRVDCCIINILLIFSLNNYINGKSKTKNLFLTFFNILVCGIMIKTRLLIVSYIFVFLAFLILWKKNLRKKLFIIIIVILAIPSVLNSTIIKDTIDTVLENDEDDIRTIGKAFYIGKIKESPLTGRGFINTQWSNSFIGAKMDEKIYIVDNGIYGFLFEYGLIGLFWYVYFFICFGKKAINNYKKHNNYWGILYLVHITILLPNITWWSWDERGQLCMVLIMAVNEYIYNDCNKIMNTNY